MKIVGRRKQQSITFNAPARLLKEGANFNDEIHRPPGGQSAFIPRGIYRFATHEEANEHWENCIAQGIARTNLERTSWKNSAVLLRSKS
ncbi:MAG: hypothetical protein ACKVQA_14300 [Burkholderiales bacterium]